MTSLSSKNSEPEHSSKTEENAESQETEGSFSEGAGFGDRSVRFSLEPSNILKLQKSVGNRAVTRIIARARDAENVAHTENGFASSQIARVGNGVQRTPKSKATVIQRETTLTEGMTSEEVKALQTKLNQVNAATPPLKIDGIFGPKTKAAVISFQQGKDGLTANGTVEDKTWAALNKATTVAPTEPTTPPVTGDPSTTPPTSGTTPPVTGDPGTTPPTVTPPSGSGTPAPVEPDSVEVRKKLNKLGVADANSNQIILPETGAYDDAVRNAVKAFQKSRGITETGTVDAKTEAAMNATVHTEGGKMTEVVGGVTYGANWNYDWQVTDSQIHITVKIKYTNGSGVSDTQKAAKTAAWMGYIKDIWNVFKAVNPADGKSLDIAFDPIVVTGSEHASVQVAAGAGRANAAKWYVVGDGEEKKVIAHEFGHLISLPDEYQLSHKDFKDTTGVDAPAGATVASDGATVEVVTDEMKEAIDRWFEGRRVGYIKAVVAKHGLKQGSFAQAVVKKYKEKYSKDLVNELVNNVPTAEQWGIIDPFTSSTGGIMGNFYQGANAINSKTGPTDAHEHPLAPRHVAPFIAHIKTAKGGTWEAQNK